MHSSPLSPGYICKKQSGRGKGRSFAHDFAHGIYKVLPAISTMASLLSSAIHSDIPSVWLQKGVDYLKSKESDRQYIQEDLDVARKGDYTWQELLVFQESGYQLNHETWTQLQDEMPNDVKLAIEKRLAEKRLNYDRQFMMDGITYPEAAAKLDSADPAFAQKLQTLINNRAIYQREKMYDLTPAQRVEFRKFYSFDAPVRPAGQARVDLAKLRHETANLYSGNPTPIKQLSAAEEASLRAKIAAKRAPLVKK